MYTQCPDCRTTFRVTAGDLRQAAGKVRCGDCGAAFDALLYLSEDMPESAGDTTSEPVLPELKSDAKIDRPMLPESISANESIALLQTLDELAGSDIRIEDTGIEWRVLDEVAMSKMGTDETRSDDEAGPDAEVRYDDDSPLPDVPATDSDAPPEKAAGDDIEDGADSPEPQHAVGDIDTREIDDSGDWEAILEDIDEPAADKTGDENVDDAPPQSGEDAAQDGDDAPADEPTDPSQEETGDEGRDESGDDDAGQDKDHESGDDDSDGASEDEDHDEGGDDDAGQDEDHDESGDDDSDEKPDDASQDEEHDKTDEDDGQDKDPDEAADDDSDDVKSTVEGDDEAADDAGDTAEPQPGKASDEDSSPSQWQLLDKDEQDDSIPTLGRSRARAASPDARKALKDDLGIESIVLEGDSVRIALEDSEAAASLRAAAAKSDFGATNTSYGTPTRSASRRGGVLLLLLLLLAALGLQAVHQRRDTLAKIPAVNDIIGPFYRMIGKPLAPAWDVTGWSFEATTGNAQDDDERLNIYTRIGNRSDEALPYPLIGVSLTDRFEEVIGSRVLEPSAYLPSDMNPRKLIAPGESFEAYIAVETPDVLASGYKLDVCYRLPDRRLRCAIGDFR